MANSQYSTILLAIDFFDGNEKIIERATDMAGRFGSDLHLLHVNQPPTPAFAIDGVGWSPQVYDIMAQVEKHKQEKLSELAARLKVAKEKAVMVEGRPAAEIHAYCDAHNVDLVVMGTHGQKGLALLLGSTANSVLHGFNCDVLAVRINE